MFKLCSKGFKRPQDLKKHERIHTVEHQGTYFLICFRQIRKIKLFFPYVLASLLSNQPGYKPVRRRRKTTTEPSNKTSTSSQQQTAYASPPKGKALMCIYATQLYS